MLRVATWNIWWRYGQWQARHAAIRATLQRIRPDIVALNEVWQQVGTEGQASDLGRCLGLHAVARYLPHQPGVLTGNAILSRWPIRHTDSTLLSRTRSVLYAEIDSPHGSLLVFTTHLSWRPDESSRRQDQIRNVLKFISDQHRAAFPPILMGDLNAEPNSDELRMLTGRTSVPVPSLGFFDAWEQVGDGTPGHTYARSNPYLTDEPWPSRRIDHVLPGLPTIDPITGWFVPLRCWVDGSTPVDGVQPSDHYAVVAELRCLLAHSQHLQQQVETLGVDHVAG